MRKHFQTAWQHIRRSPYQAMSIVLIMTLIFTTGAIFAFMIFGSQAILSWFETRPQVTGFFKEGTKIEQIQSLQDGLNNTGKVANIKYISKDEALAIYREQNKNDPLLLEMVTANILPASLEVSTKSLSDLEEIAGVMKNDSQVEEVIFQKDVVSSLSSWTNALRKIGLGLIIVLSFISLSVILVNIGMKIALKKEEIEILKLIGASSSYIRLPFIIEGIFYGIVGAVIASLINFLLLLYTTPFLVSFLSGIPIFPINPLFLVALFSGLVVSGIFIGILGSYLATKRYLR
jgi:cell division transport system permease protein